MANGIGEKQVDALCALAYSETKKQLDARRKEEKDFA